MEEMREAAKAYVNMSRDQSESFLRFYGLMDKNGDGKVSIHEYNAFISEQGYNYVPSNLFGLLDKNTTGYLYYEECITFFYMVTCNRFVFCNRCRFYFVGVEWYRVGRENYNLCRSCYQIQNNNYNHGHSYFLNNYDLHHTKPWEVNASGVVDRNLYKRAMMADLVTTARLYYDKSSWDVKKSAHDFFNSLDSNNDGKVSLQEFLGCMWELGHLKIGSSHFFNELDQDMNGSLEFMEVMALYYIIKSGRPFCSGYCDEFIPGMYFGCSVCFENGNNLFCVCPDCFRGEKFDHEHHQFLDSFALLEAKRIQHKPNSSVTIAVCEEHPTSTSNAVGPYNQTPPPRNWKHAWKALEMALNAAFSAAAGAGATLAAQAGFCTIM